MSFHSFLIGGSTIERDCPGTGTGPWTEQTSRLPLCSMAHPTASEVMATRLSLVIAALAPLIFQGLLHLCKIQAHLKPLAVAA